MKSAHGEDLVTDLGFPEMGASIMLGDQRFVLNEGETRVIVVALRDLANNVAGLAGSALQLAAELELSSADLGYDVEPLPQALPALGLALSSIDRVGFTDTVRRLRLATELALR